MQFLFILWALGAAGTLFNCVTCLPLQLQESPSASNDSEACTLCQATVKLVQDAIDSNATLEEALKIAMPACLKLFKDMRADILCPGILESYGPVVQYVVSHELIEPRDICVTLKQCPRLEKMGESAETTRLTSAASDRPSTVQISQRIKTTPLDTDTKSEDGFLKIVQFNDVHLDPYYKEGTATDCGLFVCCRSWQPGNGTAGHFGDFNCDLPLATLDLLLETIDSIDPDFIIFAGDNPPHDFWNETAEGQLASTEYIVNRVASFLPNRTIYPTLGNHETYPQSQYLSSLPLYQEMTGKIAEYWQKWVKFPQEALETIAVGGYYTIMMNDDLQLISLNSDFWYGLNFYSFLNGNNRMYVEQINWLESTLKTAADNSKKVLLLAHIPSGDDDNLPSYGEVILNVTKRYKEILVGVLTAHTHEDQFQLIQDIDGIHGVTLISPSVTPFGHINPSFRIYYMDKNTYRLVDYEQYHLDLTKANDQWIETGDKPAFELFYRATEEYSIPDISPSSWGSLVERFEEYSSLIQRYYYNVYGGSKQFGSCKLDCQKNVLCQVKYCSSLDYYTCKL